MSSEVCLPVIFSSTPFFRSQVSELFQKLFFLLHVSLKHFSPEARTATTDFRCCFGTATSDSPFKNRRPKDDQAPVKGARPRLAITQPTSTLPQTVQLPPWLRRAITRSALEAMDTPITINIDPEGDLFLDATADPSNRKRFRVCSQALRRKSPVWKRMLFGPWKESKPANDKEWVVELPDDPVRPLQIILSIIHSNFDAVPGFTSIEIIHQVLIMTNKYDITSIVRPWSLQWLQIAELPSNAAAEVVKSLYIAWELGSEEVFASKLEHISLHTELDSKGRLFFDSAILLEEEEFLGPQTALGKFRVTITIKVASKI